MPSINDKKAKDTHQKHFIRQLENDYYSPRCWACSSVACVSALGRRSFAARLRYFLSGMDETVTTVDISDTNEDFTEEGSWFQVQSFVYICF